MRFPIPALLIALAPFVAGGPSAMAATKIVRATQGEIGGIAADATLWTWDHDTAAKKLQPLLAQWTSSAKDTLRAEKGGKILELDAGETLLRFDVKTGKPDNLEMLLYNKGDKGEIGEKDFNDLIAKATAAVNAASGQKPRRFTNEKSATRPGEAVWAAKNVTYVLEWSPEKVSAGNRPEFVKLIVMAPGRAAAYVKEMSTASTSYVKIEYKSADHLETNAAGDKWIKDVPMVDQGQKGYCAVASTERVLRLFGMPVDQHDLAQLAEASGDGGTNPVKLVAALRKNSGKLRLNPNVMQDVTEQSLTSLVTDYNKAARKTKTTPLPKPGTEQFYKSFGFDKLDGATLLEGRGSNTSGVRSFEDKVAGMIDKGLPIMWGVALGYAPENPALPQAKGGHMRLIIGYNKKTGTIIYTDSWGAGHERKTMTAGNAFAITETMIVMSPK